jgi:hypothetical protein
VCGLLRSGGRLHRSNSLREARDRGLGFKRFRTAWRTLVGYETLAMMRKGQVKGIGGDDIVAQAAFVNSLFDDAA